MDILTYINPTIVSVVVGLIVAAFTLILFVKPLIQWITARQNTVPGGAAPTQPAVLSAPRPTLAGLSWMIATSHRSNSQIVGLIMSIASLTAIVLSVISAVAGISIISYQQFGSIFFTIIAGFTTLILALLIENTSLNALKSIRLANEEIAQAEQTHYEQIVKQMEEQFEEDKELFAQLDQKNISKEEVQSMKRAASLKQQARKQFERKRHTLMRQQTRTTRRTRTMSIPFAILGILFSASAGGLFWHTVLASLALWLNATIGTMFALAVSITFVQSEILKRIKDDAIAEALRSGEMQNTMLKQQSEEMVLELVVDSMAAVKADPNTLIEMGTNIKEELRIAIRALTQQTTARLIEDTSVYVDTTANEVPAIEAEASSKKERKEPEWLSHPALSEVLKRYPKLNEKVPSWRSASRVTISINSLVAATDQTPKMVRNRIKDSTLKVSSHNPNLILLTSVIDWLRDIDPPKSHEPITEEIEKISGPASETTQQNDSSILRVETSDKLSIAIAVMRINPQITNEELAPMLSVKRSGSAQFWRLKAQEILNGEKRNGHSSQQTNEAVKLSEYTELLSD